MAHSEIVSLADAKRARSRYSESPTVPDSGAWSNEMKRLPICTTCVLATAGLGAASQASADMTLDAANSSVSVVSMKVLTDGTKSVAERFRFGELEGSLSDDGAAEITIPLDSIQTGIDIRNERMQEFLFETGEYPNATITASVPANLLQGDGAETAEINASLSLHGQSQDLTIPVVVDRAENGLVVTATEPVLLEAGDYDLQGGLGKLTELAGLLHIPTTVPVSFTLNFVDGDS